MIKIRESQLPPSYKDYIDNWVAYEKSRTEEEKLYWDSIWNQLDKTLVNTLLGIPIYTISGAQVRGLPKDIVPVDLDFCLGGTWARYPWIVDGAMAIEYKLWNCANEKERIDRNAIIVHEHVEVTEGLTEGIPYEKAHEEIANREESRYRFDPKSSKYYTALTIAGLEGPIQESSSQTDLGMEIMNAKARGLKISSGGVGFGVYRGSQEIYRAKDMNDLKSFILKCKIL